MDGRSQNGAVDKLSEMALVARARKIIGADGFRKTYAGYTRTPADNLLPGIQESDYLNDLGRGAGSELLDRHGAPAKFCAVYSSSALAVNTFAPFRRHPVDLHLFGESGFTDIRFESKFETGLGGTPPHLDVFIEGPIPHAIESKCIEYLRPKSARPAFADSYAKLVNTLFEPSWLEVYAMLKSDPLCFAPLDATQLVKHYLGLRNFFGPKPVQLLYLFWEPKDAADFPIFLKHRDSVARFADMVKRSSVTFSFRSYESLWGELLAHEPKPWLAHHVASLRQRYSVCIGSR